MPFYGDPYTNVSAISDAGGIVLSRSSGVTPAFVQVSASAITATGTSRPYETLEYSWNFGDSVASSDDVATCLCRNYDCRRRRISPVSPCDKLAAGTT